MKRSIIAVAALATFSFASVGVQATPENSESTAVILKDDRKEIKYEDLPEKVRTSFEDSQFSNWEVSEVHEVEEVEATRYEITISDGTQKGTIAYNEDGEMIG